MLRKVIELSDVVTVSNGAIVTFQHEKKEVRFFVANARDSIQEHHLKGGFYEPEELALMSEHWRADGAFVDIGANVGNHAIFVSKFLDASKIIVFEPNPPAIAVLQVNLLLNQCANVDRKFLGLALGASDGFAKMVPDPNHPNNLGGTSAAPDPTGEVVVVAGDTVLASERIAFLKIDIEGMELEVLAGLEQTISRWRPNIFIEVRDTKREAFTAWASEREYRIMGSFARYKNIKNYMLVFRG